MILTDSQRLALQFVRAANVGGYRPTKREVDEWRLRPDPRPGKRGRLIKPSTPGTAPEWMTPMNKTIAESFAQMLQLPAFRELQRQVLFGSPGTPEVREPDGPPEEFLDSLIRLSWLEVDVAGGLSLTPLSRALLRAEEIESEPNSDVMVLDRDSKFAYATLVGHIAEQGEAMIVDPYLKPEQLFDLISRTSANRYLVGPNVSSKDSASMQTLVSSAGWAVSPELRKAGRGEIHDRFIISETNVFTFGLSLNGVGGSNPTVLMPLPEQAADHIRQYMEGIWANAGVLKAAAPPLDSASDAGPRTTSGQAKPRAKRAAKKAASKRSPTPKGSGNED